MVFFIVDLLVINQDRNVTGNGTLNSIRLVSDFMLIHWINVDHQTSVLIEYLSHRKKQLESLLIYTRKTAADHPSTPWEF